MIWSLGRGAFRLAPMEQLPFLTQKDFDLACNELFTRGQAIGLDIRQCQDVCKEAMIKALAFLSDIMSSI